MSTEKISTQNSGLWKNFITYLRSPGRQVAVQSSAPTQIIASKDGCTSEDISIDQVTFSADVHVPDGVWIYDEKNKKAWGARFFDAITQFAGSSFMFLLTCLVLAAWAIVGGVLGAPDNWQIAMQDGSSIQCYISDTLLMRQQHNNTNRMLTILAQLRSRCATFDKLIKCVHVKHYPHSLTSKELHGLAYNLSRQDNTVVGNAANLPTENIFDVCCNWASEAVGSLYALGIYWGGIIAWVALGHKLGWSDEWQLYVNTAVAVELTFTSMFLQNTRRRHMNYLEKCLHSVRKADTELEVVLRRATDGDDTTPNPVITILPPKVSRGVRFIDYYGDVIGTGIGAFISLCVFVTWFAIGNTMQWSDDWWLIIGTYTGLVGFVDGFVLRNVYFRQDALLDEQFKALIDSDMAIYQFINVPPPEELNYKDHSKMSFGQRLSNWMGTLCATPLAVLFSVLVVIGLICFASSQLWNTTAQLVCNTPTMIIEGFLLIVLLQAHNMANTTRRIQMHGILMRRLKLLQYVYLVTNEEEHTNVFEKYI